MAQIPSPSPRSPAQHLVRFFSVDSARSSTDTRCYEPQPAPQWNYSFKSVDFALKIAQLIIAVICTGLYSKGILLMKHSITSVMFPNIVFSSFIIITSVITISYVLGHVMPDILTRIFNTLGAILYFVAAGITGHFWIVVGRHLAEEDNKKMIQANMILAQTILTAINAFLYGYDAYYSIKRALKYLEINPE